jgi:hypothetical protein
MLLLASQIFCQTDPALVEMALKEFKPTNKNIWWLKDMYGTLDYNHPIHMVIVTDNKVYKGAYKMINSNEIFYLQGTNNGEDIVLVETDTLERITGYITGQMSDDKFYCSWSDKKKFQILPMFLSGVTKSSDEITNVGWAGYFKNNDPQVDSLMAFFISTNAEQASGKLIYPNSSYSIVLEIENDDRTKLRFVPNALDVLPEMLIDIKKQKITFIGNTKKKDIQFSNTKKLKLRSKTYVNFEHNLSFNYPEFGNKKFDQIINDHFIEKYMTISNNHILKHEDRSISDRLTHIEYGDFKCHFINDTIISGIFFFQSSKHSEILEFPFNYLIRQNTEFDFKKVQLKNYSIDAEIESFIEKLLIQNKDAHPKENSKKYFLRTFDDEGMRCKTAFNSIYGDKTLTIPYHFLRGLSKKQKLFK